MTRAASITGFVLALVLLLDALRADAPWFGVTAAVLLVGAGVWTLRGHTFAHLVLCVLGLALLARSLPLYFRTLHPWPFLAIIGLATGTLGLGVVGFLLDRYEIPRQNGPTL